MVANIEASLISELARRVGTNPLEGVALVGVERLTGSNKANKLVGDDTVNGGGGSDKCVPDKKEASIKSC